MHQLLIPMRIPRFLLVCVVTLLFAGAATPALAQSNEAEVDTAKAAAQEWLDLLDANRYEATWETAASMFRAQVTAEQWTQQIQQAHSQLDSLQSRSLVAARYTTSLPNVPEGEYVVAQYRAQYGDTNTVETITLMKDDDAWCTAGYFVQPENQ